MGGFGGAAGAGAGGMPDSRCPPSLDCLACETSGFSCVYDVYTGCLCLAPPPVDCLVVDARCPSAPVAGSTHGGPTNTPRTCDCIDGEFGCHVP